MSRTLDMDLNRFSAISDFVTNYIREQDFGEGDGAQGRTLIRLCLEEFLDETERQDREIMTRAKDKVVASIKRLVSDGGLCLLRKDNKPLFRLTPEQSTHDDERESTIVVDVQQRDMDAEEAETSLLEEEDLPMEETEADRHSAGYAEMTRGARPLLLPPAEDEMSTPSRKRRRIEIAGSNSSCWDSLSPAPHANSTPRRRQPLPVSPLSGSRRRFVPMQFFSPRKLARDTRDHEAEEYARQMLFKHEKDTSPPWLVQGLDILRSRYPDDTFKADNGMIKCLDCGRDFKPSSNCNVSNFENHLKSKAHKVVVIKNRETGKPSSSTYQEFLPSKKMFDFEFADQQMPYHVFALQGEQDLASKRNSYLAALETESHKKSIRLSFLEKKLLDAEKQHAEQRDHFDKVLETSDKTNKDTKEKFNILSDVVKSTEEKCETKFREVFKRVEKSESKNGEHLRVMSQRMIDFEGRCDTKLGETNTRIARYNQRALDQHDSTNERIIKSELESEAKLAQLSRQIEELVEKNKSQDELIAKLQSQDEEHTKDVQGLQEQSQELEAEIKELERENKGQEDEIQDLLAQTQLHTEELQRQRDSEESFMKTIRDQMQAYFEQTDRTIRKLTSENQERTKSIEQQMLNRIKAIEDQSSKKIRSLEKKYSEQKESIECFEAVIPTILDDARARDEYVDELARLITEQDDEVAAPSPRKEKGRRYVARTSVAR
ncbi:hypothetical protein BDZ45DRAFT_726860 [Acephala macrosclerotiorum]|nr:hypothetical protein BDZ45DRAFT_726860 [Acephala macrosclerotiorum]